MSGVKVLETNYLVGRKFLLRRLVLERNLIFAIIASGLITGLLEGGAISLIALAVNFLINGADRLYQILLSVNLVDFSQLVGVLKNMNSETVFVGLVLVAISFQIIKSALSFVNAVFGTRLQRRLSAGLQDGITRKVLSLSYAETVRLSVGGLQERIRLGENVSKIALVFTRSFLALVMLLVYLVMMFSISPELAILAGIFAGLILWILNFVVSALRKYGAVSTRAVLDLSTSTVDMLSMPRTIRIFNISKKVAKKLQAERAEWLRAGQKMAIINSAIAPATDIVVVLGAGTFLIGALAYFDSNMNEIFADAIIFLFILNRMIPQVQTVNRIRLLFAQQHMNLTKIGEIVGASLGIEGDREPKKLEFFEFKASIELDAVGFSYNGSALPALRDINLSIHRGEFVTIIGKSGGGKTTLLDLILGLLEPSSGRLLVDGVALEATRLPGWRDQVGLVEQKPLIINDSVRNNILLGRTISSDRKIEESLRRALAWTVVANMPLGLDTSLGEGGIQISGGEAQRICLARALLKDPKILILDEYTSALDRETSDQLASQLRELGKGITIIRVTHDLQSIMLEDRVVVLEEGRLVADGLFGQIKETMKVSLGV